MQLRTKVVVVAVIVLADEEHRGQRGEAKFNIWLARKKLHRDFNGGLDPRVEIEAVGAGCRGAVEQRIDRRLIGVGLGRLDPEFAKKRKFLIGRAGLDRKPPRRHAIVLVAAEKTEITRAEEGDDLVEDLRAVQWVMQPETGEAEIDWQGLVDLGAAIVEKTGGIGNGGRDPVSNRVDGHGAPVEMAEMEQLQPELASIGAEKGFFGAKPDIAPGIEIQFVQRFGERRGGCVEIRRGEIAGAAHNILEVEFRRRLWRLCGLGEGGTCD